MKAQAEAVAVVVVAFIILAIFAFMMGARERLLIQQAQSAGKAVNIYVSKTSDRVCISSSMSTRAVIVEYNSTHARVVDNAAVLKTSQWYCLSTQQNIAVITGNGALFTVDQNGRIARF